jgi:hypothetical protein
MLKTIKNLKSSELTWWQQYKRDIGLAFKISHGHHHHNKEEEEVCHHHMSK